MYKRASPEGDAITFIWLVARGRRSGRGCLDARLIRRHGAITGVSERNGLGGDPVAFRIAAGSRAGLRLDRRQLGGAERAAITCVRCAHAPCRRPSRTMAGSLARREHRTSSRSVAQVRCPHPEKKVRGTGFLSRSATAADFFQQEKSTSSSERTSLYWRCGALLHACWLVLVVH